MSRLPAAILALAFATPLSGQNPARAHPKGQAVVVGETITVRSEILGEDRRVHVQLPPDYDIEPDAHYPVVYQLDGEAPGPFTYVAGLVGFLDSGYQFPPMIVVGIPNTSRTRDLTPPHDGPRMIM